MMYLVEEYLIKRVNGKVVSEEILDYVTPQCEILDSLDNVNLTADDVFHSKEEAEEFIIDSILRYGTRRSDGKELHLRPVEIRVV